MGVTAMDVYGYRQLSGFAWCLVQVILAFELRCGNFNFLGEILHSEQPTNIIEVESAVYKLATVTPRNKFTGTNVEVRFLGGYPILHRTILMGDFSEWSVHIPKPASRAKLIAIIIIRACEPAPSGVDEMQVILPIGRMPKTWPKYFRKRMSSGVKCGFRPINIFTQLFAYLKEPRTRNRITNIFA
jgi:hypothetical protein